jgi:hypothetical protein
LISLVCCFDQFNFVNFLNFFCFVIYKLRNYKKTKQELKYRVTESNFSTWVDKYSTTTKTILTSMHYTIWFFFSFFFCSLLFCAVCYSNILKILHTINEILFFTMCKENVFSRVFQPASVSQWELVKSPRRSVLEKVYTIDETHDESCWSGVCGKIFHQCWQGGKRWIENRRNLGYEVRSFRIFKNIF